jgi:glycosyltransferase involved in cell wall biosynthesis
VLLEALGCETPCIGSNIGGIAEVLYCDDLLFKPLNVEELTKELDKSVKDKEYYKKVKDLCLKRRKKFIFDWHEKVINILKKS